MMEWPATVKLDFKSDELRDTLKPVCERILEHFQLPAQRLYCYFANEEDPELRKDVGQFYRGFFSYREGASQLPNYLQQCFLRSEDEFAQIPANITYESMVAFDCLIYVRNRTCRDVTSCASTFAHELQHFMQYGYSRKVWAANTILYQRIRAYGNTTATVIDIPHERDANIVSKRVAEAVCGTEAVKLFAEGRIRQFKSIAMQGHESAEAEKARWEFFRDVPSSTQFDVLAATIPLVEKYKFALSTDEDEFSRELREEFSIDFLHPQWWL
jgi:hypothetical protein